MRHRRSAILIDMLNSETDSLWAYVICVHLPLTKMFIVETVDTATDNFFEEDLMKGPNGEIVMRDVSKNQETTSSDMPVSSLVCYVWVSYPILFISQ